MSAALDSPCLTEGIRVCYGLLNLQQEKPRQSASPIRQAGIPTCFRLPLEH